MPEKNMVGRLKDKIAVVTAAAQGIGKATVQAFASEGATVFATDINEQKLSELKDIPGVYIRKLDVTNTESVKSFFRDIDRVDILFNCAGIVHHGTLLDISEKDWDLLFDINVKSMYRTCFEVIPKMIKHGGGSIINMSSVVSSIKGLPNRCLYGASKAAVVGLSRSIACDFIGNGIRCNSLCPGTIDTPSLQGRINMAADPVAARKDFISRQKIGRLGKPEEVAALCVYLGSDESGFTTGQEHVIDGGISL